MKEGENITQYSTRIKEVFNAIRGFGGVLEEDTVVSKILRTLLPTYAIRVSAIQEMREVANKNVTLDSLIGRLISFEMNNFDNSVLPNIESAFKSSLRISNQVLNTL